MEEPTEHLTDTVNALDDQLQAALILVYVHQAGFDPSDHDASAAQAVAELTGYTLTKIQDCFAELKGSFLKLSGSKWTFAHPTISDALTEILRQKPHMMAALIRGATIDTILSSFTCEGSPLIRDALVIQTTLDDALVARLGRTPDELHRNWMLFRLADAPKHTASLNLTHHLNIPSEFGSWHAGAGARYVGERAANNANDFWLSSYTVADAFVRWESPMFGYKTSLQFNVDNLFNKQY